MMKISMAMAGRIYSSCILRIFIPSVKLKDIFQFFFRKNGIFPIFLIRASAGIPRVLWQVYSSWMSGRELYSESRTEDREE
jgi:hypothetical protein